MYTRCPACQTVFHLRAAQLSAAQGQVRCGDCGEIFQSLSHLYDNADIAMTGPAATSPVKAEPEISQETFDEPVPIETPEPSLGDALAGLDETPPPDGGVAEDDDQLHDVYDAFGTEPDQPGTMADAGGESPAKVAEQESTGAAADSADNTEDRTPPQFELPPDFILDGNPRSEWSAARVASWVAASALILALIGQGIYVSRGKLANDPDLLPWIARFCSVLDCDLPFSRDVGGIQIVERQVREHPDRPGALLVYTTFVNTSSFVQPYPVLELRLADLSGGRVAGRRFSPDEYLPENANVKAGLPPAKPVSVELEIIQPDINVVSYQFDFL